MTEREWIEWAKTKIGAISGHGKEKVFAGEARDGYLYGLVGIVLDHIDNDTAAFRINLVDPEKPYKALTIGETIYYLHPGERAAIFDTLMALEVVISDIESD